MPLTSTADYGLVAIAIDVVTIDIIDHCHRHCLVLRLRLSRLGWQLTVSHHFGGRIYYLRYGGRCGAVCPSALATTAVMFDVGTCPAKRQHSMQCKQCNHSFFFNHFFFHLFPPRDLAMAMAGGAAMAFAWCVDVVVLIKFKCSSVSRLRSLRLRVELPTSR